MERYLNKFMRNAPKEKGILEIYAIAEELEKKGKKLIHMDIGRPNFDTPKVVKDRAIRALEEGYVHYTSLNGVNELKAAIAEREKKDNGIIADPSTEILITVGASEALFHIWLNFLGEGDEILVATPCYSAYIYQIAFVGAKIVSVPLIKSGKLEFDIEDFRTKITPKTKMIMVNSPNNPTGFVLSRKDLQEIANLAIENDLIVVSDECYDKFVFSGGHISIATLPCMKDRTITVNSASKTFSMTGWRVGYVIANPFFIDAMALTHANIVLCATSFAQIGAIEAYNHVYDEIDVMLDEFKRRRDYIMDVLEEIKIIDFVQPDGAFYIFFNVENLKMDGMEFCLKFLKEYGVTTTPGISYGQEYNNYVRMAYTCTYEDVVRAMDALKEMIKELNI